MPNEKPQSRQSASKRITIRSTELQALGRQLAKEGEQKRKKQEKARASVSHYYWPSKNDYLVWCDASDHDGFYLGIEEFCQYVFDMKSPEIVPHRPMYAKGYGIRYRTFGFLARRWNAGDFRINFNEI
jgi:hypothetical protein